MGAITRAAANNFTTGGVILPAGINDASVASVSALAQVSAGDGITLISSQTASSSASIEFTSGIDSTYRTYVFKLINIHPASNANLHFNLSTDGGSTYSVAKTTTNYGVVHNEGDTEASLDYKTVEDAAQSTGNVSFGISVSPGNDESFNGTFYLFNPSSTTYVKHFLTQSNSVHGNTYSVNSFTGGYGNTSSAINAIRFLMSTGNIDAGTIYMYGIA